MLKTEPGINFIDSATKRTYSGADCVMYRTSVGRCDICIFMLRREPRVFIGGGESPFGSMAREADSVEVEALAERFRSDDLSRIALKMRERESRLLTRTTSADTVLSRVTPTLMLGIAVVFAVLIAIATLSGRWP